MIARGVRGGGRAVLRRVAGVALLVALAAGIGSCAYYNSYYLARKNYFLGTNGAPYPLVKPDPGQGQSFQKAVDYSKKVISEYPKSKLVDDAYLLWAKALLGRDDPLQTINMLADFPTRFPKSPLKNEALFILGVAQRQARRYADAEQSLGQYLQVAGKSPLVPYAELERARALSSLERYDDAAKAAGAVLEKNPRSALVPEAREVRGEALFQATHPATSREDFRWLGAHAKTDEDRLTYLLRECDALEAAHQWDEELSLLRRALSHEVEPVPAQVVTPSEALAAGGGGSGIAGATGLNNVAVVTANDHYGRLETRIGTVQLLAGRQKEALDAYGRVMNDYPRTPLAAEAQYRIGYAWETGAEDFVRARSEYARVRDQFPSSPFAQQAQARLSNLDRVTQFRSTTGDTSQRHAEAGFLLAELYLFQHDKPDRALEQYRAVADSFAGTPWAAKAMVAEGWVLSRKLDRKAAADSLWWEVVRHHAGTEAQLAARDYLEAEGQSVPPELIKEPLVREAPPDTTTLTPPPTGPMPLGSRKGLLPIAVPRLGGHDAGEPALSGDSPLGRRSGPAEEPALIGPGENPPPRLPAPADTTLRRPAPRDSVRSPR